MTNWVTAIREMVRRCYTEGLCESRQWLLAARRWLRRYVWQDICGYRYVLGVSKHTWVKGQLNDWQVQKYAENPWLIKIPAMRVMDKKRELEKEFDGLRAREREYTNITVGS